MSNKVETKICSKCGEEKVLSDFHFSSHHNRHYGQCKSCRNEIRRANRYKKDYGITIKDYDEAFVEQEGCCAICGRVVLGRRLDVDHSHSTGKVRGLLCNDCNLELGIFEKAFKKFIPYLRDRDSY